MLVNELNGMRGGSWYAGEVYITEWRVIPDYKHRFIGRYRTCLERDILYLLKEEVTLEEEDPLYVILRKAQIEGRGYCECVGRGRTISELRASLRESERTRRKLPPGMRGWVEDVLSEVVGCS
jgi:hypothetical protein